MAQVESKQGVSITYGGRAQKPWKTWKPLMFLGYAFRGKNGNPTPWKETRLDKEIVIPPENIEAILVNAIDIPSNYQEQDIHDVLGFQGVIMLDSGGYQYLSRGITPNAKKIMIIQENLNPEIIIPLDQPIPRKASQRKIKESQRFTIANDLLWQEYFGNERVLPVIHGFTLKSLSRQMKELGEPKQVGLGSVVPQLMHGDRRQLLSLLHEFKQTYPSTWVHVFGVSYSIANLLFLIGIDSVDSASWIHNSRYGSIHLPTTGPRNVARKTIPSVKNHKYLGKEEWEKTQCQCKVCKTQENAWELYGKWGMKGFKARAIHNAFIYQMSVWKARQARKEGKLKEHVQEIFQGSSLKYLYYHVISLLEKES